MSAALPASERLKAITIEPAPVSWGGMISGWRAQSVPGEADADEFRRELALPADRPLILTGHQAEFWHPGILAKYLAADAAAAKLGAQVGWVVVDQDSNPPGDIRYPHLLDNGQLTARTWRALPAADAIIERNVPLGRIPPSTPASLPTIEDKDPLGGQVRRGLEGVRHSLGAHAHAPSVAHQVAAAVGDRLRPVLDPAPLIFATELARTRLFSSILERMRTDPARCARTYNEAAAAHPDARMAPLRVGDDPELPLWLLGTEPMHPRIRATARHLAEAPDSSFAPRALLMTAILRIAGCDLFIHGLGGGIYDRVTEKWMHEWLGAELAPTAVVSATLLLPIDANVIAPEEIDRAAWRAHRALHDPALLGDPDAAAEKSRLLQRIRELKRARESPAPAFAALHELLERTRSSHAERLAELENKAAEARSRRTDAAVAHDRTWPFPLFAIDDLLHLKNEIGARFG